MEKLDRISTGTRTAVIWLTVSVLVVLALVVGLSRQLEKSDPELATAVFPLNANGTAEKIASQLARTNESAELLDLRQELQGAIGYDRVDARLFGLMGEITGRLDGEESARPYFDHAFRLSKTELLTLHHMVVRSVQEVRPVDAIGYLDVLLRRWPDRFDQLVPILPALLSDPAGYQAVLARLGEAPPWRGAAIAALARQPETTSLSDRLIFELQGTENPPTPQEISTAIAAHIRDKRYDDAYRMFLFTLTPEEQQRNGYVFNGEFSYPSIRRPFDWQFQDQSGVEIAMPARDGGALVRFLDKPVKSISLQQYLHLPPGEYRLTLEASARNLSLPKNLFWSLRCADPNSELGRIDVPEGTYSQTRVETDFEVAAADCPIQSLRLETGLIAESWRYRYAGSLTMHRIMIERIQP
jgi:hypothetical protein